MGHVRQLSECATKGFSGTHEVVIKVTRVMRREEGVDLQNQRPGIHRQTWCFPSTSLDLNPELFADWELIGLCRDCIPVFATNPQ